MADGVSLADEADPLDVYTIHRATEDEARELADGYFSKYGVLIDDSKTDIYDDTIIFYSTSLDDEGSNLSIWCDYEGPTVSFTDFSNIDDENSYADAGLSEEFVREKLENLGVVIPENAVFAPIEEYDAGNYRFTNDGEILDDGLYYKGTIECCINSSGKIANFRDSMIKYTPYKKVDVISEKEAYDRLCAGKFYFPDYDKDEQLSDLVVKSVKISYTPDSKGYYRPVYEFVANVNQDTGKREISGSVDEFVTLMNEKAKNLGLKNTNFANPHGLDNENHYSTAYDMAIIAKELLKHEDILKYTSIYEDYLTKPDGSQVWLVNTNRLVRFYDGVDGLKTGYTTEAGYCLTATAKKNDLRLISVVMKSPSAEERSSDTSTLLTYGFNSFKSNVIYSKDKSLGKIKIEKV